MTASVKFLFDTDFSAGAKPRPAAISQAQHEAALAEAEERGHRKGVAAGRAQAIAEHERQLTAVLGRVAAAVEAMIKGFEAIEAGLEQEAVEVAVAMATRLAPALIEREPFAEIAALASECFRHLVSAPHVVVRVADTLYEEACARIQEITERSGFSGRLIVLAEAEMAVGDCRIEWADGGVTRDRAAVERAIADIVDRYLASRASIVAADEFRSAPS